MYVVMPFGEQLYTLEAASGTIRSVKTLDIPNFKTTPADKKQQAYTANPRNLQQVFAQNSTVTELWPVDGGYVAEVLHMHDGYNRVIVFWGTDFEYRCHRSLDDTKFDGTSKPIIRFTDGRSVYFYREELYESGKVKKVLSSYH